jgi:hypothetical protein
MRRMCVGWVGLVVTLAGCGSAAATAGSPTPTSSATVPSSATPSATSAGAVAGRAGLSGTISLTGETALAATQFTASYPIPTSQVAGTVPPTSCASYVKGVASTLNGGGLAIAGADPTIGTNPATQIAAYSELDGFYTGPKTYRGKQLPTDVFVGNLDFNNYDNPGSSAATVALTINADGSGSYVFTALTDPAGAHESGSVVWTCT